jgi:hypothetical protein
VRPLVGGEVRAADGVRPGGGRDRVGADVATQDLVPGMRLPPLVLHQVTQSATAGAFDSDAGVETEEGHVELLRIKFKVEIRLAHLFQS